MKGLIYVIHATGSDFYKIGWTKDNVKKRVESIQTGCPYKLNVVITYPGTMKGEKKMQADYYQNNYRGEWFKFSEKEVLDNFGYTPMDFKGKCETPSKYGRNFADKIYREMVGKFQNI